ncbi:LysE family transporter [Paenibacillus taichungensis]|uniref:LysE family transporter n=1 Tax=Paenibacillus taichungensis TaxID=484184 RepID=A0ABX2MK85_9BACL|nr:MULTISPECIES: LysE family transporter [Paenibacillus]NUU54454.1 LysE family transporter [Paenibacillus taichungensis]PIH61387.1 lysine transporter LysE [Paenibacillus sp. LK1]
MEVYLKYFLIGLAIAMPVGAITVEMTKQGLKNGFIHGWAVGLGGMTIDVTLILAMYFGFASVLALPYVQIPLWLVGAGFLAYLGYDSIKNADKDITPADEKTQKSFFSTYRNGLLVAVSPGNLIFWVSVFGAVLSDSYSSSHSGSFAIAACGVMSGILIHDLGLLSVVSVTRRVMSRSMIRWVSVIAGILLFGFSLYFLYEFIMGIVGYV